MLVKESSDLTIQLDCGGSAHPTGAVASEKSDSRVTMM
jgi:hypothetical protein